MWPFRKRPQSAMDIFLDQIEFYRYCIKNSHDAYAAKEQLTAMNKIVMEATKIEINADLEKRLKSMEDAISDLYLTGRTEDKK